MNTLRSRLIRLASENPDLRPHILPILKEGGESDRVASVKRTVSTADTSAGYWGVADALGLLETGVSQDPVTKDDRELVKAVMDLREAHRKVRKLLDESYNWKR